MKSIVQTAAAAFLACVMAGERILTKDFESAIATAQAWLFIGNVQILIRRMART